MTETIDINGRADSPAIHFAFAAIIQGGEITRRFVHANSSGNGTLQVELKINGVSVPFVATIEDIYRRIHESCNERAAQIAYETASLKGLGELRDTIQRADWEIRNKIEETFGVSLKD